MQIYTAEVNYTTLQYTTHTHTHTKYRNLVQLITPTKPRVFKHTPE